jgi:putative transposase
MKWKNVDAGAGYYFITGTFTEWLPLLRSRTVRSIVCSEISGALTECEGYLSAFVLIPDHVHLLVYLPHDGQLHVFNRLWRGRAARRIVRYAQERNATNVLRVMAHHAHGRSQYAVWKEQARALHVHTADKLQAMVNYIHANPVRRGLAPNPGDWQYSSWAFYNCGAAVELEVTPPAM